MNCGTLVGRLPEVIALAAEENLDILVLQEVRVSRDSMPAVRTAARAAGWTALLDGEDEFRNSEGALGRGTMVLARWPVGLDHNPLKDVEPGRFLFFRIHREGHRPIRAANLHLDATDEARANQQAAQVLRLLAGTGDDFLAIGDWNLEELSGAIVEAEVTKRVRCADECAAPGSLKPTGPARVIDFALHSS